MRTSATCTQTGPLVTNDYTLVDRVGYNPVALAYTSRRSIRFKTVYTHDPNACNPDSSNTNSVSFLAGSTTQALIKISAGSDRGPDN